ncbi:pentapeptide repeat-containing protein [Polyangium aurulentum]|uniref:WD40 domain-containing protein n=1 Tax=Polyangium aurulentum TaxID=2567896 RepID=UPI0010ADF2A2|nr:pentapeptide repeat-containing protein [Polyangium aurulentum]UQA61258.1 pentapeptide repeat-containing protein [Polyangium aurulentum]
MPRIDVLIVTALQDELDAVLSLGEGGREAWRRDRDRTQSPYFHRELPASRGRPMIVAAAWLGERGDSHAPARATALVEELDPACLAICGLCTGRSGVSPGDVIVADRVYAFDHDKLLARDEGASTDFFHAIDAYAPEPSWGLDAAFIRENRLPDTLARERPIPKRAQMRWFLHALYAHETEGAVAPLSHPDRKARCPDWTSNDLLGALRAEGLLEPRTGALALTQQGRLLVLEERLRYPDGLPDTPPLALHVGPIATGKLARPDPRLFDRLDRHVRRTFAVEHDALAIGHVAAHLGRRSIIVKAAASTAADPGGDEATRAFACRAAASFLVDFLARNLEPEPPRDSRLPLSPELASIRPGRGREPSDLLDQIEVVCRLREPDARIERRDAPPPFGAFLQVAAKEGHKVRLAPVAALDGPVTEAALEAFLQHVDAPYRAQSPFTRSTLVHTGDTVTPAALAIAERSGVRLVTLSAYKSLVDFSGYLARQTARLEADPVYPPSLYVEQRAAISGGGQERDADPALDALADMLRAPHPRFVLVLGGFGTGKTFLLHELARRMAGQPGAPVPVLVNIRSLVRASSLDALLAQHLGESGMARPDVASFRYMLREGRIALLFDGFDELASRVTYDRADAHFDMIVQATEGDAKVVITSRTQHFRSKDQVLSALGERANVLPGYRVMQLEPFDRTQILRFLENRLGSPDAAAKRFTLLSDVKDLVGLSQNPRMLSFIAELDEPALLAAKERRGEISAARLYKMLLNRWIDHEYERAHPPGAAPGLTRKQRWVAITELAKRLWESADTSIDIRELPRDIEEIVRALGRSASETESARHQIGSGTLLVRDDAGRFSFIHQSVLEWLVAHDAAEDLKKSGDSPALGQREMSDLMADFFVSLAGWKRARDWAVAQTATADRDHAKANAVRILGRLPRSPAGAIAEGGLDLEGIDLRGQNFTGADLRGARLARSNLARVRLVGANLEGASLAGASLASADLSRAQLQTADLSGAVLARARLLGADLRGANLLGASLRGAKLVGARIPSLEGADAEGAAPPRPASFEPTWLAESVCNAVAFAPSGELIASGHDDGSVRIWDAATSQAIRVLAAHTAAVTCIAFTSNGRTLVSGSSDGTVALWNVASGNGMGVLEGHTDGVRCLAVSPDGALIASGSSDRTVRVWQASSREALHVLTGHARGVRSLAFSPDGQLLASGSSDRTILLWTARTGRSIATLEGHVDWVTSLAFSPDGQLLASGSSDRTIHLWHAPSGRSIAALEGHGGWVTSVAFAPSGQILVSGSSDKTIRMWHVPTHTPMRILEGHGHGVTSVAPSPDGQLLASGSSDRTIHLWHLPTGNASRVLAGHAGAVTGVAPSPDGHLLATGADPIGVHLWDLATGRSLRAFGGHAHGVRSVAFAPAGRLLASGSSDKTISLWDADSGERRGVLEGHARSVSSLAFAADGRLLASGSHDRTIALWAIPSGSPGRVLEGHLDWVTSVAFAPVGSLLASGSFDKTIHLWDTRTGRLVRVIEGHTKSIEGVAFAPSGDTFASAGHDATVVVWSVSTGRAVRVLQGHEDWARCVTFSPDGRMVASGSSDRTLRLWDAHSGQTLRVLRGHAGAVTGVAFGGGGRVLASSSLDGTIRLWDMASGGCAALFLPLAEGWVAFRPDGRYKLGGDVTGGFWHAVNLCRFEPGELDEFVPGLRLDADEPLVQDAARLKES